jgi:(1->4)-alpha-D-glucan 1-alpha-D-glucosylmutase
MTSPGVPDIYQGSELWSFNLVDPDNRRPVDFGHRAALLDAMDADLNHGTRGDLAVSLSRSLVDGRAKLYLIRQALALRRTDPDLFEQGDYRPLMVEGPHAERLCAYARSRSGRSVVVLVPRLLAGLVPRDSGCDDPFADSGWCDTRVEVPAAGLEDVLNGVRVQAGGTHDRYWLAAGDVLRHFPVGLLTTEEQDHA